MITGLGEVVECVVDNKLRLTRSPPAFTDRVKREFTYPNPAYEKARRMGIWDLPPRTVETYALDGGALVLPRGGAAKVRGVAADMGVRLKFVDQRQTAPVEFPSQEVVDDLRRNLEFEFTPRQQDVIEALIQRQNAYLHASTGHGKTATLLEVVRRAGQRCLFLVPDTGILQQTIDAADRLLGVGYAGKLASKPHELPAITCTTYAMAHRAIGAGFGNAERFGATEWAAQLLLSFGMVVCDEMQFAAARTVSNVVEMMPAKFRFGMSADSTRKDGREFISHDSFGQLADHITVTEAVEEGRILQARMVIVPTGLRDPDYEAAMFGRDATPSPRVRRELYQVADDLLRTSSARNRMIASRVAAAWRAGHYCLVLARRIEHCEDLQALIEDDTAAEVLILQGGNKQAFDDACNRLRNGDCRIAVGTSKAYQGLDIPRLDRGFIATPTATNPQLLEQMIGRFRRVADGKVDAVVEYYWDDKIFPGHKRKLQKQYGNLVTVEDPR